MSSWTWALIPWGMFLLLLLLDAAKYERLEAKKRLEPAGDLGVRGSIANAVASVAEKRELAAGVARVHMRSIRKGAVSDHQADTQPTKRGWLRPRQCDSRTSITALELEHAITEITRDRLGCESFIGVIVQHTKPRSKEDANWTIRGVRFGKANRNLTNEVLVKVVQELQDEFKLAESDLRSSPAAEPALTLLQRAAEDSVQGRSG